MFIYFYLQSIFLDISLLFIPYIPYLHLANEKFFSFQGLRKLREGGQDEVICSPPGVRGTPGARAGHGRYSCELASGPGVSQGPQSWWAGPSFPQCFIIHCRGLMGSLPFGLCPKDSPLCPHYFYFFSTEGGGCTLARGALPMGPSEAATGPLGSCQLPLELQGSPPVPCHISQLALPAGSFKHVDLTGSGKLHLCEWCISKPPTRILWCLTASRSILGSIWSVPSVG